MKSARQNIIMEIISNQDIETQSQLLAALAERGIKSTQATLSRDIKDMHLVKEQTASGAYKYSLSAKLAADSEAIKLKKILKECVTSYDIAQNIIVIKTLPGLAPAACSALDMMNLENLVGTLAGDNTAFLAMKDNNSALQLYHEIEELI